jgi:UDP-N-acetyl-D-glucosamine dehydrogenase
MPRYVIDRVVTAMNDAGKCLNGANILVAGVAYKRDVSDVRESPALDIIELLRERKAQVSYADPYVPNLVIGEHTYTAVPLDAERLRQADCVVIVTDHRTFDYAQLVEHAPLIVDTRNATKGLTGEHIHRL